jgi:Bacterial membrane protein YfhO
MAGPDAIAALALAALAAAVFYDVTLGGRVLYERDAHLYLYPHVESLVRVVSAGSWPLWNPYFAFGEPMLANPQFQVFYPPTWLNFAARPWIWFTAFVLIHLAFSGAGVYALARRLDASRLAAWVGGAAWMLSGPLLSLANNHHHLTGAAWMPWVLLAADRAFGAPRARGLIVFAATFAVQIVAGSPDTCAMTGVLCGLDLLRHLQRRSPWSLANGKKVALAAGAVALALGLSAAQWLPTVVVASRSARPDLPGRMRTYWSMHPANLLQAIVPISFHELPLSPEARATLFESREPFLMSLYLGVGALVLVAMAVLSGRPLARTLAFVALIAVLLAMGRHTLFYSFLATVVPPVRMFRYPVKAMLAAALCWSLLTAIGLDAWRGVAEMPGHRRRAVWAMAGLAVAISIALVPLAMGHVPHWVSPFLTSDPSAPPLAILLAPALRRTLPTALLALVVLAGGLTIRIRPALGVGAMGLAAVADLALAHAGLNRTCPPAMLDVRPPALAYVPSDGSRVYSYDDFIPSRGADPLAPPPYTLAHPAPDDRAMAALGLRLALYPSLLGQWSVENSYDFDQLQLFPRPLGALPAFVRLVEGTPTHLRLLRMGAVSRAFALHATGLEDLTPIATLPSFFLEPLRVFAVPDPLPRAYMAAGARIADGDAAWAALADPKFDPSREVILPDGDAVPPGPFDGRLRVVERKPDRLTFEVEGDRPAFLVMVEAYDEGWRARVDGVPTRVLRANVGFRAVAVPAGRHVVTCTYRPVAVAVGLALSLLSALGAIGIAWAAHRHRADVPVPADATPGEGGAAC